MGKHAFSFLPFQEYRKKQKPGQHLRPFPEAPWAQLTTLGAFGLDELGEDGDHGLGLLLVVPRVELSRGPRGHPPKNGPGALRKADEELLAGVPENPR